jgi:hypothetical protein
MPQIPEEKIKLLKYLSSYLYEDYHLYGIVIIDSAICVINRFVNCYSNNIHKIIKYIMDNKYKGFLIKQYSSYNHSDPSYTYYLFDKNKAIDNHHFYNPHKCTLHRKIIKFRIQDYKDTFPFELGKYAIFSNVNCIIDKSQYDEVLQYLLNINQVDLNKPDRGVYVTDMNIERYIRYIGYEEEVEKIFRERVNPDTKY